VTASAPAPALAAYLDRDPERALALLLERWRATRDPRVSRVLFALSDRLASTPIAGEPRWRRRKEWNAVAAARQPRDTPRLVAAVGTFARKEATELLEAIDDWEPDPRVARGLLAFVDTPPDGFNGLRARPFWERLLALVERHADAGFRNEVDEYAAKYSDTQDYEIHFDFLATRLADLAWSLNETRPAAKLRAKEAEAYQRLERLLEPTAIARDERERIDELFAAVYANPQDDSVRLVLADALVAADDPRGEFIQLQCRTKLSREARAREKELLGAYGRRWLGAIDRMVRRGAPTFRRGFAAALRLDHRERDEWEATRSRIEWATVEELDFPISCDDPTRLIERPQLRALRSVTGATASIFDARRELSIERLTVSSIPPLPDVAASRVLPHLKELTLPATGTPARPEAYRCLWENGALGRQLDMLTLAARPWWGEWYSELARIDLPLAKLVLATLRGWCSTLVRRDGSWSARLAFAGDPLPGGVSEPLVRQLGRADLAAVATIEIEGIALLPSDDRRAIERFFVARPHIGLQI
jgi:uncharacterized protein (TIGR02996 family)